MENHIKLMHKAQMLHEAMLLAYYIPNEPYWVENMRRVLEEFDEIRALYADELEAKK